MDFKIGDIVRLYYSCTNHTYYIKIHLIQGRYIKGEVLYESFGGRVNTIEEFYNYNKIKKVTLDEIMLEEL